MRRRSRLPVCLLGCLVAAGCSTLPNQKELGRYVSGSLKTCEQNAPRCAAALQCGQAARDAIAALQADRGAQLAGVDSPEAARALALPPAALVQCKMLGIKPAAAPAADKAVP